MGCGNGQSAADSQTSHSSRPGEKPAQQTAPLEETAKSDTAHKDEEPYHFDESKIDKNIANYHKTKELDEKITLFQHKSNKSFVIQKNIEIEAAIEDRESGDLLKPDGRDLVQKITKLRHPHIVCYLWADRGDKIVSVYVEHCIGGSLEKLIQTRKKDGNPFSEEEMRSYLLHMTLGLGYIHSSKIIHRKMRPSYVMFSADNVAKIADFGEGAILKTGMTLRKTKVGPEIYMAPEMINEGYEAMLPYSYPVDVWALGIIFHEMATYEVPFPKVNDIQKLNSASEFNLLNKNYSENLRQLAKKILSINADERLTCDKIVAELRTFPQN